VDPAPFGTTAAAAVELCDGDGAAVVVAGGVVGAGVVAAGFVAAGPVRWVMMLAVQVTPDPPTFPVPLHWLTEIEIAALTVDLRATVQCTAPPPPLPEPLHWVTVAPVTGAGLQSTTPPPPLPEPTHWVTPGAVRDCAPGVFCAMLLVMFTLQLIACAASLSELLHCRMTVTRLVERVVNVPFGVEQGPSAHLRVTVVVEPVVVPLMVLTTVTVHLISVVAPAAPGAWPLHWSIPTVAARAAVGRASPATENALTSNIRAITSARKVGRDAAPDAEMPDAEMPDAEVPDAGIPDAGMQCAGIVSDLM
jgi:hypothetical protein